jgi:hypothetical protein
MRRLWLMSLRRRSQNARLSREKSIRLVARFFPPIKTLHSQPCHRFDAKTRGRRSSQCCSHSVVVISSNGEGGRSVESLEAKAPIAERIGLIRAGGRVRDQRLLGRARCRGRESRPNIAYPAFLCSPLAASKGNCDQYCADSLSACAANYDAYAPPAAILFDKFHVIRQPSAKPSISAQERVCAPVGEATALHQGTEIHAVVAQGEPHLGGPPGIEDFAASQQASQHRLPPQERSFGQLWSYEHERWARRFFENWRASLKWQRLKPYEKFADMVDRHWDGITAYCKPENKVSLGLSRGSTTKSASSNRHAITGRRAARSQRASEPSLGTYDASKLGLGQIGAYDGLEASTCCGVSA